MKIFGTEALQFFDKERPLGVSSSVREIQKWKSRMEANRQVSYRRRSH